MAQISPTTRTMGSSFIRSRRVQRIMAPAMIGLFLGIPLAMPAANAADSNPQNGVPGDNKYHAEKLGWGQYLNYWTYPEMEGTPFEGSTAYLGSLSVTGSKPTDPVNDVAFCVDWQVTTNYDNMEATQKEHSNDTAKILSHIIAKHGGDTTNHRVIAVAVHHLMDKTRSDRSDEYSWGWAEANIPQIKNTLLPLAEKWISDAKAEIDTVGKYKITPKIADNGYSGEVTNLQVKDSDGNNVGSFGNDKVSITVKLTGNATFDENGAKSIVVKPGESPDFTVNGSGEIKIEAVTNKILPTGDLTEYQYADGANQNKVILAERKVVSGSDSITVGFPSVGTKASDKRDGDQVLYHTGGTIVDTVEYSKLIPGKEYEVRGELMDKATGKGTGIVASKKFIAQTASGAVDLEFKVPSGYAGKTIVVFERLYHQDREVAAHTDINDQQQTVTIGKKPTLKTTALDKSDQDHNIVQKGGTIVDTVKYTDLKPGVEYSVSGELTDKATGKGTGVKAEAKFTPRSENGSVNVEFVLPEGYEGKTLVAFETLTEGLEVIAEHKDLKDPEQTIYVAGVGTVAKDASDNDDYLVQAGGTVIDTVAYTNLKVGQEFTLTGELMDQKTGKPTGIKASTKFTPKTPDGSVELSFKVPAEFSGTTLTAFETISLGNVIVAEHKNINDAQQTVFVADMDTNAVDALDGDKFVVQGGGTIVDTITFTNVDPKAEHLASGELFERVAKEGGGYEAVATGIKASKKFTPSDSNGATTLAFKVPAEFAGKDLTVFDQIVEVKNPKVVVAQHKDINSDAQTVEIADVGTQARDQSDGDQFITQKGGVIEDKVKYTNLIPGQKYKVVGELQEKLTAPKAEAPEETDDVEGTLNEASDSAAEGSSASDETVPPGGIPNAPEAEEPGVEPQTEAEAKGTGIFGEVEFVAEEKDGEVVVAFNVPEGWAGKTLVAFEAILVGDDEGNYDAENPVAVHDDINDVEQTVTIADLGTVATDKLDGDKHLVQKGGTVVDTVEYSNLAPGEYVLEGELMDRGTGEATGITSSKTFTVDGANTSGSVEIEFEIPEGWAGKSLTAFESVTKDGSETPTAEHKELESDEQTVHLADLGTSAIDQADGDKILSYDGGVVVDSVRYENLVPGTEYTVEGELMDKATGKGTGITGKTVFTPEAEDGTVEVLFTVDAEQAGKTLVAFEEVRTGDLLVAEHKDIDDAEQTVGVGVPPAVKINSGEGAGFTSGSNFVLIGSGAVALAAAAGAGTFMMRRRKISAGVESVELPTKF